MRVSDAEVKDAGWVGDRLHGRLLVRDAAGRAVLAAAPGGRGGVLPGGALGEAASLIQATREHAESQLGAPVVVDEPRLVTLTRTEGLVVVFDGSILRGTEILRDTEAVSGQDSGGVDDVVAVVGRARDAGRVFYRETLWWAPGPVRGHGGSTAPSPGERFIDWVDADIAMWLTGVALGVFPETASFMSVRSIVSTAGPASEALHRVLTALADAGVLEDEDGSGAEFRWAPAVDQTGC